MQDADPGARYLVAPTHSLCDAVHAPTADMDIDRFRCTDTNEAFALLYFEASHADGVANTTMLSVLALVQSLADVRTTRPLVILLPERRRVSEHLATILRHCAAVAALAASGFRCSLVRVSRIPAPFTPTPAQAAATRPDLIGSVLAKLHAFHLKCATVVLLDADQVLTQNVDDLFVSARSWTRRDASDPCVIGSRAGRGGANLLVLQPSEELFQLILSRARERHAHLAWHAPEQELIGLACPTASGVNSSRLGVHHHLPDSYSSSEFFCRRYGDAFDVLGAKVLHFLGGSKPWHLAPPGDGLVHWDQCVRLGSPAACRSASDRMVASRCYKPPGRWVELEKRWAKWEKHPPNITTVRGAYACCERFFSAWLLAFAAAQRVLRETERCRALQGELARE